MPAPGRSSRSPPPARTRRGRDGLPPDRGLRYHFRLERSGRPAAQILAFDARAALDRLGLPQALTPQRANGLNNMVGRIRQAALAAG